MLWSPEHVCFTRRHISLLRHAGSTYGRSDAAFNNADVNSHSAPLLERRCIRPHYQRNLRGVWNRMKAEIRPMMAQESEAIVHRLAGCGIRKDEVPYCGIGLSRSVALEYVTMISASKPSARSTHTWRLGSTPRSSSRWWQRRQSAASANLKRLQQLSRVHPHDWSCPGGRWRLFGPIIR